MSNSQHVHVRAARTADISVIRALVDTYAPDRRLLSKATVTLYEDIQEFSVAEVAGEVVGCGALHVMWADLAEVRTVAVEPSMVRSGIGRAIVEQLIERAVALGVQRLFCLTFETIFFSQMGFSEIAGTPVSSEVYRERLNECAAAGYSGFVITPR